MNRHHQIINAAIISAGMFEKNLEECLKVTPHPQMRLKINQLIEALNDFYALCQQEES